ncbi:hypothetical protein DXG01_002998, partial [Tephrocybe rancida]
MSPGAFKSHENACSIRKNNLLSTLDAARAKINLRCKKSEIAPEHQELEAEGVTVSPHNPEISDEPSSGAILPPTSTSSSASTTPVPPQPAKRTCGKLPLKYKDFELTERQ